MKKFAPLFILMASFYLHAEFAISIKEVSVDENVQHFTVKDYTNDGQKDIIYLKENGDLRVGVQRTEADDGTITQTEDILLGEDVSTYDVVQFNNDDREDIVFQTSTGALKVALQDRNYEPALYDDGSQGHDMWALKPVSGSANFSLNESTGAYRAQGVGTASMELLDQFSVDISNMEEPTLHFKEYRYRYSGTYEGKVEAYSPSQGGQWTTIYSFNSGYPLERRITISLQEFFGATDLKIRFSATFSHSLNYWQFRNIEIKDKYLKKTVPLLEGPAITSSNWSEDQAWTVNEDANYLQFKSNNSNHVSYIELNQVFDLTQLTSPHLYFEDYTYKYSGTLKATVQVSETGAENDWHEVYSITQSDTLWKKRAVDLSAYSHATSLHLRISANSSHNISYYYIRDIDIKSKYIKGSFLGESEIPFDQANWSNESYWTTNANGNYLQFKGQNNNFKTISEFQQTFDLTSMSHPHLYFEDYAYRYSGTFNVSVQINETGAPNDWIEVYLITSSDTLWKKRSVDLSAYNLATALHLRIVANSSHNISYYYIRDIEIKSEVNKDLFLEEGVTPIDQDSWSSETYWSINTDANYLQFKGQNNNFKTITEFQQTFDLSSMSDPQLHFEDYAYRYSGTFNVSIQVSETGESNDWSEVYVITNSDTLWKKRSVDLNAYNLATTLHLRIVANSSHNISYYYIRNIEIKPKINKDSFLEEGVTPIDQDSWSAESYWTINSSGNYLQFKGQNNNFKTITEFQQTFDLSAMSDPQLHFEDYAYRYSGTFNVSIQVSETGESNDWSEVYVITNSDTLWKKRSVDLSAYNLATTLHLRIVANSSHNISYYYIRDIEIKSKINKDSFLEEGVTPIDQDNWSAETYWTINSSGNYLQFKGQNNNFKTITEFQQTFDLSAMVNPRLYFEDYAYRYSGTFNISIQINETGDSNDWNEIYVINSSDTLWKKRSVDLSAYNLATALHLRIVANSSHNISYYYIRNIEVSSKIIKEGFLGEGEVGIQQDNWATETYWTINSSGNYLQFKGQNNNFPSIVEFKKTFNPNTLSNPHLYFEDYSYRYSGTFNVSIQISESGEDTTWTEVYSQTISDSSWVPRSVDLTAFSYMTTLHLRVVANSSHNLSYYRIQKIRLSD